MSCFVATLPQVGHAQAVAIDNGACPANPGAVVTTPATGGVAISGAADCPGGATPSAQVDDPGGIAIGNDRTNPTITEGTGGSIAIGNNAHGGVAGASNASAFGTNAQALENNATALGAGSIARAGNSVAVGGGNAISSGSVAIGQGAVTGDVGDLTRINQIAIGLGAAATAQNSIAIGTGSIANGPQATALGSGATAGVNSTATGRSATAGNSAVAYGVNANAGLRGTALGQGAAATVQDSTAIGSFASATFANSVALGRQSVTNRGAQAGYTGYGLTAPQTSVGEVSIGTLVGERQLTGVAAGSAATDAVNVSQLTAIDAQADLLGTGVASAIGGSASYDPVTGALTAPSYTIQGVNQTSVGGALSALDTQVTTNATNIATNTGDIANLTTGISNGTIGLVQQSAPGAGLTVGAATDGETVNFAGTGGDRRLTNVAAGAVSAVSTEAVNGSQLFTGNTSVATALGGGTVVNADGTLSAPSYTIQGAAQTSVGGALTALDGQVTTKTTDIATNAANIATNAADIATNTGDIANLAAGIGGGTIGLVQQSAPGAALTVGAATDGTSVSFAGTGGDRRLTNVAAGTVAAASSEAINGSQLFAGNTSLATALGGGSAVNPDGTLSAPSYAIQGGTQTSVGGALTALDGQMTTNTANIAANTAGITTNTNDIADLAAGIGNGSVGLVRQSAPGADLTVGAATDGAAVSFAGTGGDRRLTNVAAGTVSAVSNEAVNGSQLYAGNASLAAALGGGAAVNPDGTLSAPSYMVQGASRSNVGDALTALDTQVTTNTSDITDLTNAIGSGAVGLVRQANPNAPVTVAAATGGSSVDFTGTAGSRTLTGVADGAVGAGSVEAVNGGQLANTAQSVADALGGGAVVNPDGSVSAPSYAILGSTQTSVGGALTALDTQVTANTTAITGLGTQVAGLGDAINTGKVGLVQQAAAGAPLTVGAAIDGDSVDFAGTAGDRKLTGIAAGTISGSSTDAINGSQLSATNQQIENLATLVTGNGDGFSSNNTAGAGIPMASGAEAAAGGNGAVASGQQAVAIGNNTTASGAQSTALGYAASATGVSSVAIGAGSSDGGQDNVVSVGSAGAERRITNVAMGVDQTDAVNLGQLTASMNQTLTSANAYTDRRFSDLAFDIEHVRRDNEGATAASMALAGIPQSFERGMGMVGMGVGTWQGESAVALGISKATDGGIVFKAGATYSSRGQGGANGGVGIAF